MLPFARRHAVDIHADAAVLTDAMRALTRQAGHDGPAARGAR